MLHGPVKLRPPELVQRTDLEGKVGIIDEHVDGSELTLRRTHHLFHFFLARDVGLPAERAPAGGLDAPHHRLGRLAVLVVVDQHGHTALGQPQSRRGADAAACTRD